VAHTDVFVNGEDVIPHHILIPATTGRGKSNFIKVMFWNVLDKDFCGILVLDPHDEYYGKNNVKGLRDHPKAKDFVRYYSPSAERGAYTLVVSLRSIDYHHFRGISEFTTPQEEAMATAYHTYGNRWIENILRGSNISYTPVLLEMLGLQDVIEFRDADAETISLRALMLGLQDVIEFRDADAETISLPALMLVRNGFLIYATMRNLNKSENIKSIAAKENLPIRITKLD
jgi:uncharacterized protein DUF87